MRSELRVVRSVEFPRIEQLLRTPARAELSQIFSADELADAGDGAARVVRLAARLAAKQSCLGLFARDERVGTIGLRDFVIARNGYGAPHLVVDEKVRALLDQPSANGL